MNNLKEYMEISYRHQITTWIEHAIRLEFPLIKDLAIENDNGILHIAFTTGATKEEVESFLDKFKR